MAKKKTTVIDIYAWGERNGWELDRWGNMKKGNRRIKFQKRSIRLERRVETTPLSWVRIRSAFISKVVITDDDKLGGLTT